MVWPDRRRWHCGNGEGDEESDVGAMDVDGIGDPPIRLVGDGVDDTGVKEWTMLYEACKFPGATISLVHEDDGIPDSCGGCGLMEPDSESEEDDLPDDKESVVVKLERGGGGLEPYNPFPFTIFKDNALLLLPPLFFVLLKCFIIDFSGMEFVILEVAPSKQIKFAEVS